MTSRRVAAAQARAASLSHSFSLSLLTVGVTCTRHT